MSESMKKPYIKPKKHKQYRSSDPYGHRVSSTPPKSKLYIMRKEREISHEVEWFENEIMIHGEYSRHNPRFYRGGIEAHNDLVRRYYQGRL